MDDVRTPAFSEQEVMSVYGMMGLATASDRARFVAFGNKAPTLAMDVIISTTSRPF